MSLHVLPVSSKRHWDNFLRLPNLLHQNDPNWVPPLQISVKNVLNKKNPFFKHAKIQIWIAYHDQHPVGRIVAVINDVHNDFHNEKVAFWGFFESINDHEVVGQLFAAVTHWAQEYGVNVLRGPVNLSTNYECGLQISAFDTRPFVMMPQNPAYYPKLIELQGFVKAKDLEAWKIEQKTAKFHPKLLAKANKFSEMHSIIIRPIHLDQFDHEIEKIYEVYNDAWEKNWGFVPMKQDEFYFLAKAMKAILFPHSCYVVEVAGEMAGFGIWLPDINQVLIKIRNGKLLPTGAFKLFWYTKVKKLMNQGRILTLGIRKKFRHLNLGSLLYTKYLEVLPEAGYPVSECSWILEDNQSMRSALRLMNAEVYKIYRIYEKKI